MEEKTRVPRVLIDTNILVLGALDIYNKKESDYSTILKLCEKGKLKSVVSIKLLEEYYKVAKFLVGKDFAGWLRNLILAIYKPIVVADDMCEQLEARFKGEVPDEDLTHFVTCLLGAVNFLISENREFIREVSSVQNIFKCRTAKEFLEEYKK